jgi:peptidoglycan/LPS O-acetylase OafA/YrhL
MSTNLPPNEQPQNNGNPSNNNALIGLVVVAVGGFFLLRNFGVINWDVNWWAFFLLIPAGGIFLNVWQEYKRNGEHLNRELRSKLVIAAGFLLSIFVLLTGLEWERYWPMFLILGGVALLLNALGASKREG